MTPVEKVSLTTEKVSIRPGSEPGNVDLEPTGEDPHKNQKTEDT